MRAVLTIAIAATAALLIHTALAPAGGRTRPSGIVSADARLQIGEHKTLLTQKGLGHFTAACSTAGVSVTFTADRLLPTSDLVVRARRARRSPQRSSQASP